MRRATANRTSEHPGMAEVVAYAVGRLPSNRMASVEQHLARCPFCRSVAATAPDDRLVARLRRPTGATPIKLWKGGPK